MLLFFYLSSPILFRLPPATDKPRDSSQNTFKNMDKLMNNGLRFSALAFLLQFIKQKFLPMGLCVLTESFQNINPTKRSNVLIPLCLTLLSCKYLELNFDEIIDRESSLADTSKEL